MKAHPVTATRTLALYAPVLIVGNPCRFSTYAGLYGYVSRLPDKPEDGFWIETFRDHDAQPGETRKEWPRFNSTTVFNVQPADLRPLTGKARLARVARLMAHKRKEDAEDRDPALQSLLDQIHSPEAMAKERADRTAIEAEQARIGRVFTLPGVIKRGDKSAFPAYNDPTTKAISAELMDYAQRGPSKCTVTERARWAQCLEATAQASFWSPRAECRAIVKELDLDPMANEHEGALWRGKANAYAVNGTLRAEVIRLWNRGAQILYVQDMESKDTCWGSYKTGEPAGFLVTYAFRRKLPVA